jgi:hypothetical protein
VVALHATRVQHHPADQGAAVQTTTPVQLAAKFCLDLFSFDGTQGVKHQLDDAVVLQGGQGNQLRCRSNNNPKSWMMKKIHVYLADTYSLRLLATMTNC